MTAYSPLPVCQLSDQLKSKSSQKTKIMALTVLVEDYISQ